MDLEGPASCSRPHRYPRGSRRVLANIFGKTPGVPGGRFALALGLPKDIPTMDLIAEFGRRSQQRIPPRRVTTAPCKENILVGNAVDVTRFPVPFIHGPDGGRFVGTWHVNVTKDPEEWTGELGHVPDMIHDARTLGWFGGPVQHGIWRLLTGWSPRAILWPSSAAAGQLSGGARWRW